MVKRKRGQPPRVSSLGRVQNRYGRITNPIPKKGNGRRYFRVDGKNRAVSCLVADAFHGAAPPGKPYVNHKNLDHADDRAVNLEYVSHAENNRHSYATNPNRGSNGPKQRKPVESRVVGADAWTPHVDKTAAAEACGMGVTSVESSLYNPGRTVTARGSGVTYEFRFAAVEALVDEVWKAVGEGGAAVSNRGRYRNCFGAVTTPTPCDGDAYCRVGVDGVRHSFHRLVIEAHGPAPGPGQTQVDHCDSDPTNNDVANLRWVTPSENIRHSYATNSNRRSCASQQSKPVEGRPWGGGEWTRYDSGAEAARAVPGTSSAGISDCCRGKQTHCGGWEWRWTEADEPALLDGEEWRDIVILREEEED